MQKINFEIDKKAFDGPFTCHGKTKLISKELAVNGNTFQYEVWQCSKCKKDYLDTKQAKKMETIWIAEKLLNERALTMSRSLNFDGKMFFLRFPKELTKTWNQDNYAEIKVVDNHRFIVEVKN